MKKNNINLVTRPIIWYTESLHRVDASTTALFRCPICLQDINDENQFTQDVAKAHIIPKAFGGKSKTYVCCNCDNKIGHTFEGHFINLVKNMRILAKKQNGKLRGKQEYTKNNVVCPAQMAVKKDKGWEVTLPRPGDAVHLLDKIPKDRNIRNPVKLNFFFTLSEKNDNPAIRMTMLKISYLGAFLNFGYDYILHKQLDWIRYALLNNDESQNLYDYFNVLCTQSNGDFSRLYTFNGIVNGKSALVSVIKIYNVETLVILPPQNREYITEYGIGHSDIVFSKLPKSTFLIVK